MRIERFLKQTAVWWQIYGHDAQGHRQFEEPVEIKCRWEDLSEEFADPNGQTRISRSKVLVERDLGIGDLLLLGTMDDVVFPDEPLHEENGHVMEIQRFDKIPDRRARKFLRIAWL